MTDNGRSKHKHLYFVKYRNKKKVQSVIKGGRADTNMISGAVPIIEQQMNKAKHILIIYNISIEF